MLELDLDMKVWLKMPDEEQQQICIIIADEYNRLEVPIYERVLDIYKESEVGRLTYLNLHNWRNIRTNLRNYARPPKLDEDLSIVRWRTLNTLYQICGLLEYIGSLYDNVEGG